MRGTEFGTILDKIEISVMVCHMKKYNIAHESCMRHAVQGFAQSKGGAKRKKRKKRRKKKRKEKKI